MKTFKTATTYHNGLDVLTSDDLVADSTFAQASTRHQDLFDRLPPRVGSFTSSGHDITSLLDSLMVTPLNEVKMSPKVWYGGT